jgi:hypothetical protein
MNDFAVTSKMLGDAGEHYALSQFTFAGKPTTKMPDGWAGYDLAVHSNGGLLRVSVKTRSETDSWKAGSWFIFDETIECDWLVFIFKTKAGLVRSWVVPYSLARELGNVASPTRKDPHMRDVSWAKLNREPLQRYENNWQLNEQGTGKSGL